MFEIYRKLISLLHTFIFKFDLNSFKIKIKVASIKRIKVDGDFSLGDDFFSGEDLYISTNKYCSLVIGEKVMFGPQVMVLGGNHNFKYSQGFMKDYVDDDKETKPITIEKGVWIGAKSTILSGATICEGAVVGANSLVSDYVPPFCIATGVPCKMFRARFSRSSLAEYINSTESNYALNDIIEIYSKYGVEFIE